MNLTRRRFIISGLIGLVLSSFYKRKIYANKNINPENSNIHQNYELISGHIYEFLKDYLEKVSKKADNFKKNVNKYGLEDFTKRYQKGHFLCLGLAKQSIDENREITKQEYITLGKKLCKKAGKYSSSHIDYFAQPVIIAQTKWAIIRTEHFKNLIRTKGNFDNFSRLIQATYTKQQYESYVAKQNKASKGLYAAMEETMNPVVRFFGGSSQLDIIEKYTLEVYNNTIQQYFKTKEDNKISN
jgi:hypothetical protein